MDRTNTFTAHINEGYASNGSSIILGAAKLDDEVIGGTIVRVPLKTMNRHGLISGATVTGIISGEEELFKEYLLTIYQSYRIIALFLFVLVILISYTVILPVKTLIISGLILAGIVYLLRLLRLIVIFMTNNISIFYLILYLCALEILPVLISLKYIAGLI